MKSRIPACRVRMAALAVALAAAAASAASLPELVTPEIDSSIQRGLKFLASRQRNGTWAAEGSASYSVYHTALCGTVFLQSGSTPHEGPYAEHIMKATTFLMGACQPDGFLSVADGTGREMYGHGMAMLFLSQAYGMLHDSGLETRLRDVLTRAVAFSAKYQSQNGGWHYNPTTFGDEGSVAITQIHGLRACHSAGIPVPKKTIERFVAYIEKLENRDGSLAYVVPQRDNGVGYWGVTCAGAASFFFSGSDEHPLGRRLQKYVSDRAVKGPANRLENDEGHADYVRFCLSTALFLWRDANWAAYYRQESSKLLPKQLKEGNWFASNHIYGTGMALYFLQLPYKQLPILQQ